MKIFALFGMLFLVGTSAQAAVPITCASDLDESIRALPEIIKVDRLEAFLKSTAEISAASGRAGDTPAGDAAEIILRVRNIQLFSFGLSDGRER